MRPHKFNRYAAVQTKKDPLTDWSAGLVAAVLGFEPKITESESVVLPLHYTATNK